MIFLISKPSMPSYKFINTNKIPEERLDWVTGNPFHTNYVKIESHEWMILGHRHGKYRVWTFRFRISTTTELKFWNIMPFHAQVVIYKGVLRVRHRRIPGELELRNDMFEGYIPNTGISICLQAGEHIVKMLEYPNGLDERFTRQELGEIFSEC